MEPLRVAAVQAEPVPGDVAGNAVTAARLVERAAADGARVAVLPELFLPAYHPPTLRADPATDLSADVPGGPIDDARLDPVRAVAGERAVAVVVGAAVRYADGRRTCAAVVAKASCRGCRLTKAWMVSRYTCVCRQDWSGERKVHRSGSTYAEKNTPVSPDSMSRGRSVSP